MSSLLSKKNTEIKQMDNCTKQLILNHTRYMINNI